jgi:P-type Mg2+ transporter
VDVKIITGDNGVVAAKVCREIGIEVAGVMNGTDLAKLDDKGLAAAIPETTVFARVSPDQKSRIIQVARSTGKDVAFMGDGVNDAVAIHHADVGISVDSGTDVAKDAADVVLLEKDLGVLAMPCPGTVLAVPQVRVSTRWISCSRGASLEMQDTGVAGIRSSQEASHVRTD